MATYLLWNHERQEGYEFDIQSAFPPPFLEHEGLRYAPLLLFPTFYLYPATEAAILDFAFKLWKGQPAAKQAAGLTQYDPIESFPTELIAYTSGTASPYITLYEDKVGVHENFFYRTFLNQHLAKQLEPYRGKPLRVLELASGEGQSLLALKSQFPEFSFTGIELAPTGVENAQRASQHFGLDVQFIAADITKPLALADQSFDVTFSHGVFHVLPEWQGALANLLRLTREKILFYDPMPDLWPATVRGWASLYYFEKQAYQKGLYRALLERRFPGNYQVRQAYRLKHSGNPFNENCFVELTLTPA